VPSPTYAPSRVMFSKIIVDDTLMVKCREPWAVNVKLLFPLDLIVMFFPLGIEMVLVKLILPVTIMLVCPCALIIAVRN